MFSRNHSPLQPFVFSSKYLLLPPRSALRGAPEAFTRLLQRTPHAMLSLLDHVLSIIRQVSNRWVQCLPFSGSFHSIGMLLHTSYRLPTSMVTVLLSLWNHSFHGLLSHLLASYLVVWFIPHRQSCLPDLADSKHNIQCSFIVWE